MHTRHLEFFPARVSKTLTIPETTIYDNLVMTAKKYPEKIAIEYYGGSYTYEQVLKEVEHLAGYLERTLKVKRSEEHTSELQSRGHLVCRLLLEKKKKKRLSSRSRNKGNKRAE